MKQNQLEQTQKRAVESVASFLEMHGMPKETARKMAADQVARMSADLMALFAYRFAA